jgi:hypothetical protein
MPINDFLTQIDAGALKKRLEIPAGQQPGNKGNSSEDRDTFSRSLAEESQRTRESNPSETNRDAHANENQKPDRPQPTRQDTEQEKAHSQDEIREPNGNQPVAEPQPDQNSKIENGSETSSEKKFQGIETRALENVSEIKPANDFALELTQAENFTPITVLTQIVETEQTQTTAPASLQFIFEENELEIEHSTDEPDVIAIDASPLIPPAGLFDVISTTDQDSIDQNEIANGTIEIVETPAEVLPEIPTIQIPLPSSDSTEQTESQPVDNQLSIDQQTDNVNIPNSEIGIEIPNTETPDKLINVEPEHQSEVSEIIESEKPQTQVISHQETVPTVKANHNDAVNQTPSEEPPHSDEPQNASQTASVTTSTGQNESTASLAVSPGYIKPDEPQDTASPKAEN